jgi:hypothetical protein
MYLGHASVEDFRGVTRRLHLGGLTVRVVRELGRGWDFDLDLDIMCGENSVPYRRGPAWGWAAFSHAGE